MSHLFVVNSWLLINRVFNGFIIIGHSNCNLTIPVGAVDDWQSFEWRVYEFVAWYVYLIFYNSMLINFDLIIYIDRCEQIVCVYPFYSVSFSGVSEDSDGIYASEIL